MYEKEVTLGENEDETRVMPMNVTDMKEG